jgi:uncharacterized protein (DUF983 family)
MAERDYPSLSPVTTGLKCVCPRCGAGPLFEGYLELAKSCTQCGLDYSFADSGDGASWFVMSFVCVFGVGSIIGIELGYSPVWWVHVLIAIPVLVILPMLLLRPVKALLINQQWKTGATQDNPL